MKNCDICPFVAEQTIDDPAVVLQTSRWNVVLDRNQLYLGKGFVTLREHKSSLGELDETDWRELHEVIRSMPSRPGSRPMCTGTSTHAMLTVRTLRGRNFLTQSGHGI